jgi:hypothetical protein
MKYDGFWIGVCPCGAVRAALVGSADAGERAKFGEQLLREGYEVKWIDHQVSFGVHTAACRNARASGLGQAEE